MTSALNGLRDPYVILGIAHDATDAEIHRSYKKLSLLHHPDRHPDKAGDETFRATFQAIVEAYRTLSDPESRKKYDSSLGLNFSHRVQEIRNKLAAGGSNNVPKRPREEGTVSGATTPEPEHEPGNEVDDEEEYVPTGAESVLPDEVRFVGVSMSKPLRFELSRRPSDGTWGLSLHETSDKCAVEILSVPSSCCSLPVPSRIHSIAGKVAPSIADVAAALSTGVRSMFVEVELPVERVTVSNLTLGRAGVLQYDTDSRASTALASLTLGEDFIIGVPPSSGHHSLEVLRGRRIVSIDECPVLSVSDGLLRLASVTRSRVDLGLLPKATK